MSKPRSQTIRIFLPDGNPRGVRRVERSSNSNIRLFDIPRSGLGAFCQMSEAAEMGIYFLLSSAQLYIGQTSDLGARLKTHDKTKPFWQRAFAVVLNNDFRTLDHLYCLEKTAIEQARAAGRFELDNGTAGSSYRHLHDSIRSDCENIFDEIETLLAVLNQEWFTAQEAFRPSESLAAEVEACEVIKPDIFSNDVRVQNRPSENEKEMFYCRAPNHNAYAKGIWQPRKSGFLLLKGSRIRKNFVPSMGGEQAKLSKLKQQMIENHLLILENECWVLQQDYFISGRPSAASDLILGRPSNGWIEWKNAQGQTLDEIYRKTKNE